MTVELTMTDLNNIENALKAYLAEIDVAMFPQDQETLENITKYKILLKQTLEKIKKG